MKGDTVTFRVYRTLVSTDTSQIYKLTENADGTYSAVKKFDSSTSADFDKEQSDENSPYHIYNHTAAAEDSGEYISVYFDSGDVDWGGISFYVSTGTKTLTVASHAHVYGTPEFTWSDDYTSCMAVFTCEDGDDSQEGECVVTSTDNGDGTVTYTATAEFNGTSHEDIRTEEIPGNQGDDAATEELGDEEMTGGDDGTVEDPADGGTSSVTPGDDTGSGSSGEDDNTADVPDDTISGDGTADGGDSTSTDDGASGSSADTADGSSSQATGNDTASQSSGTSSSTSSGSSVRTGDSSNAAVWFMILVAGAAVVVSGISRKRKQY